MHGKLQEVDLGEEVRMRNANMTEQARRRLAGEAIESEDDGSRKRVRIGKDGKPWRGRKRRGSDDVKRDQLVEELMRENKRRCSYPKLTFVARLIQAQWMCMTCPLSQKLLVSRVSMKPQMRR